MQTLEFSDSIVHFFQHQIKHKRLSQGYLVDGIDDRLSDRFLCRLQEVFFPSSAALIDCHVIQPSKDSQSIKIDQIRSLIDRLSRKPAISDQHVVFIQSAYLLNDSASNALLKILEEPPGSVVFILMTKDKRRLLATILSRVQQVTCPKPNIQSLSEQDMNPMIRHLYSENPIELFLDKDQWLVYRLYHEVWLSKEALSAAHQLKGFNLSHVLDSAIQVLSLLLRDIHKAGKDIDEGWIIYDRLIDTSRQHHRLYTLNEHTVLDQVGLSFIQLKAASQRVC